MIAVDTNVLFYAKDPREPEKQARAIETIRSVTARGGLLLWQVAVEYLAIVRKLEPHGYSAENAWSDLQDLRGLWAFVPPKWSDLVRSQELRSRFSLSHWDALIVSASLAVGAETLYSEDINAYPEIDGLELINPFAET